MIGAKFIQKFADRYQTTLDNVVREYLQHLFLSSLYQEKGSERLLFKGGTALRLIWRSPRFSEDLDFTGYKISIPEIESLVEEALLKMAREGIDSDIEESKKTSGGYLAILHLKAESEYKSRIQIEVSLRSDSQSRSSTALIHSDLLPPYPLVHLEESQLVREKILACLTRSKARDFYDLYFILRSRMSFHQVFAKNKELKEKILVAIRNQRINFGGELKRFLPVNQHAVIRNFKENLLRELERNLP
ncbi:MAG: nucleotidyl transferase AbiEii/AbiGii toxin family protein [Deltaproteobacteria bacterium]|nr:nucleotidyl transferase AbiEii/AbiGii toxin family protein [Deltaproteobacteria bacterium]